MAESNQFAHSDTNLTFKSFGVSDKCRHCFAFDKFYLNDKKMVFGSYEWAVYIDYIEFKVTSVNDCRCIRAINLYNFASCILNPNETFVMM